MGSVISHVSLYALLYTGTPNQKAYIKKQELKQPSIKPMHVLNKRKLCLTSTEERGVTKNWLNSSGLKSPKIYWKKENYWSHKIHNSYSFRKNVLYLNPMNNWARTPNTLSPLNKSRICKQISRWSLFQLQIIKHLGFP